MDNIDKNIRQDLVRLHRTQESIKYIKKYESNVNWLRLQREIHRRRFHRNMLHMAGIAALVVCILGVVFLLKREVQPIAKEFEVADINVPMVIYFNTSNQVIHIDSLANLHPHDARKNNAEIRNHPVQPILSIGNQQIEHSRVVIPHGYTYRLVLPDSSTVLLNSGSELVYASNFGEGRRQVSLKGEAFFKITKSNIPFVVNVGETTVTVYGTQFNVFYSEQLQRSETVVVEGSVGVTHRGNELRICPNERVVCTFNDGVSKLERVNATDYIGWITNNFQYTQTDLGRIIYDIQQWYGVKIVLAPEIAEQQFTLDFSRTATLEWALKAICRISNKTYREEGGTYYIE